MDVLMEGSDGKKVSCPDLKSVEILYEQYCKFCKKILVYTPQGRHFEDCPIVENPNGNIADMCLCEFFYENRARVRTDLEQCCFCMLDGALAVYPQEFLNWLFSDQPLL